MNFQLPDEGHWAGRVWRPDMGGPSVVSVVKGRVFDITANCRTVADLLERRDRLDILSWTPDDQYLGNYAELTAQSWESRSDPKKLHLLSPVDLQCIKACGVTFASSVIERVLEEQAEGNADKVAALRDSFQQEIGQSIEHIVPGSPQAEKLEARLRAQGLWSQYLEVGIGPYAEVFTKAPVLSSVGYGQCIGVHPDSVWNNPEPELVLVVNSDAQIVGATLGNDVNLRDIEGRSALLLGRAKDNNASCALGPLIRLLDDEFAYSDLEKITVALQIYGKDGFNLNAESSLRRISRPLNSLVSHVAGPNHQYPDGFALMTGTVFVPIQDRHQPGGGFTHLEGDVVEIGAADLGVLRNRVTRSDVAPRWRFGIRELISNLSKRGLV